MLSYQVACLFSCLVKSAELVLSRRLFREEDLPLDDDALGFVVLAVVVGSSISTPQA